MLLKHTSTVDLTVVREGRRAADQLKIRLRYQNLSQSDLERAIDRIVAAFKELDDLVDESPDPTRARLYSIAGGARG